ncbi:peptidase C39 family protein [Streptomyces sp. ST2-7A]|uniref:peptidase C39 family protein n=1 Tax=Streptomyces sp. ST2-7A TaxID=2907214 RepID=UPI001F3C0B95|nr:peptidase C39 family protein [Streptomyces sp. ST2-7A]MCE7079660.1 peptidase C39 family protein [Streptomyces sp. ST2-7A]
MTDSVRPVTPEPRIPDDGPAASWSTGRRALLGGALGGFLAPTTSTTARAATGSAVGAGDRNAPVDLIVLHTADHWATGTLDGTRPTSGSDGAGVVPREDSDTARWTSRWLRPVVPADEIIVSWNADTPPGTAVLIEAEVRYSDTGRSPRYTLAEWALHDTDLDPRRGSVAGQGDGVSRVLTDTIALDDARGPVRMIGCRVRVSFRRAPGVTAVPTLRRLAVMASDLPDRDTVPAVPPGPARGIELDVPAWSQYVHTGRHPEYAGGGEAWCSPASTQMVLAHHGHAASPEDLADHDPDHDDPWICHAARHTYDHVYRGCGNWPFNTAYAAHHPGLAAVVTRLDSLAPLEHLIAAGLPVITSQAFRAEEVPGAGYNTPGHLLVVAGFTDDGDIVVRDPAGRDNADVRRVYPRRAFETVWLRTRRPLAGGGTGSGSGGVCYLIHPRRPDAAQRAALRRAGVR